MSEPQVHFYCYYRVAPAQAGAARAAVAETFRRVEQHLGIVGRLLRGEREPWLWMEIYEHVCEPEQLESMLAELAASEAFATSLAPGSQRRLERFVGAGA